MTIEVLLQRGEVDEHSIRDNCFDIDYLKPNDIEMLRKAIGDMNGRLRVFIHPYFAWGREHSKNGKRVQAYPATEELGRYLKVLNRILCKNPPLILLGEMKDQLDATIEEIRQAGYEGLILYYLTAPDSPKPVSNDSYKHLTNWLLKLGVTNLLIGGQRLHYVASKINMREYCRSGIPSVYHAPIKIQPFLWHLIRENVFGCVGGFVKGMAWKQKFDMTISGASYPHYYLFR